MKQPKDKKHIFITLLIIFLMVGSVAGFIVGYYNPGQDTESFDYNGHKFTKTPQGFATEINNNQVLLVLDPQIVENIPSDQVSISEFNSAKKIYLTYNSEEDTSRAASYFYSAIKPHLSLPLFRACTEDSIPDCVNLPIKTCEDANSQEKIILLQKNNDSSTITYKNNCLVIEGKNDLIEPTQKAIQQLLGI